MHTSQTSKHALVFVFLCGCVCELLVSFMYHTSYDRYV